MARLLPLPDILRRPGRSSSDAMRRQTVGSAGSASRRPSTSRASSWRFVAGVAIGSRNTRF